MNEPKIGLDDFMMFQPASARACITRQVKLIQSVLADTALNFAHCTPSPPYWDPFHALMASGFQLCTRWNRICRGEIAPLLALSEESKAYIKQARDSHGSAKLFWGQFLFDLALGQSICGTQTVQVEYRLAPGGMRDYIQVRWIVDDDHVVEYQFSEFLIPYSATEETRKLVALPTSSRDGDCFFLRFTAFSNGVRSTGWVDCLTDRAPSMPDRVVNAITGVTDTGPLD